MTAIYFNQPYTKELIKTFSEIFALSAVITQPYEIYISYKNQEEEEESNSSRFFPTAETVLILCERLSIFLNAAVSRPGAYLIGKIIGYIVSDERLTHIFGKNACFAENPWHPRHIFSLVALGLSLPSLAVSLKKMVSKPREEISVRQRQVIETTLTGRPMLYFLNQACNYFLKV